MEQREQLPFGGWLAYRPGWLKPRRADDLLARLGGELAWEQREIVLFGKRVMQPRLVAWAGEPAYRYSGQTLEPRPFVAGLDELLHEVGAAAHSRFNHILCNRYRSGGDSMGFHADDERELGPDPIVAILSLGAVRRLGLKPRKRKAAPARCYQLGHGSLLVMGGSCQRHWLHGVPRAAGQVGERISLTFRWIRRPRRHRLDAYRHRG